MNNGMEKDRESNPQDPLDTQAPRGGFERFEKFEKFESRSQRSRPGEARGCQSEGEAGQSSPSNPSNPSNPLEPSELEARVRDECRKSCRRNFWIELFKTVAKVAGVVLAAFGLSSFNEED